MRFRHAVLSAALLLAALAPVAALAQGRELKPPLFDPGPLKPVDSVLAVRPGDMAPDFSLPGVLTGNGSRREIRLSDYRGRKNVMLSFVPAAFTPVCSDQWPGYNLAQSLFDEQDCEVLGISTDNLPSLFAWATQMRGLWFPVLSDFWPHGRVARLYGVLRGDGTAERAIVIVDTRGVVRFARSFDINTRPDLAVIMTELRKIRENDDSTDRR